MLSEREVEIAGLVGKGANNAEIARALYISEGTARNQVSKILKKLGLRDRTRLPVHAAERGWSEGAPDAPSPDAVLPPSGAAGPSRSPLFPRVLSGNPIR